MSFLPSRLLQPLLHALGSLDGHHAPGVRQHRARRGAAATDEGRRHRGAAPRRFLSRLKRHRSRRRCRRPCRAGAREREGRREPKVLRPCDLAAHAAGPSCVGAEGGWSRNGGGGAPESVLGEGGCGAGRGGGRTGVGCRGWVAEPEEICQTGDSRGWLMCS